MTRNEAILRHAGLARRAVGGGCTSLGGAVWWTMLLTVLPAGIALGQTPSGNEPAEEPAKQESDPADADADKAEAHPPAVAPAATKRPRLEMKSQSVESEKVWNTQRATCTFEFRNRGEADLTVSIGRG